MTNGHTQAAKWAEFRDGLLRMPAVHIDGRDELERRLNAIGAELGIPHEDLARFAACPVGYFTDPSEADAAVSLARDVEGYTRGLLAKFNLDEARKVWPELADKIHGVSRQAVTTATARLKLAEAQRVAVYRWREQYPLLFVRRSAVSADNFAKVGACLNTRRQKWAHQLLQYAEQWHGVVTIDDHNYSVLFDQWGVQRHDVDGAADDLQALGLAHITYANDRDYTVDITGAMEPSAG